MNRQDRLHLAYTEGNTEIRIVCDNCGKLRKCKIITPQDYQDIWGARCKDCMEELK